MIQESDRRWGDWSEGQWIELPDGQRWSFYAPEARTRGGRPGWTFGPDVPPDVDAILSHRLGRILGKLSRAADDGDRASVILEAGWFLLARNYNITQAEFKGMLVSALRWDGDRQAQFGGEILALVGMACMRSTALAEVV